MSNNKLNIKKVTSEGGQANDIVSWDRVYNYLEGTCKTCESVIEYFDLECEAEDVEEAMLDMNLEQCPICGWWVESCELVDDDGNIVGCDQCRK